MSDPVKPTQDDSLVPTRDGIYKNSELCASSFQDLWGETCDCDQLKGHAGGHSLWVKHNERDNLAALLAWHRVNVLEEAARECDSWGDQCCGGSGREICPLGPSKGQPYGAPYYNLAAKIRALAKEGR